MGRKSHSKPTMDSKDLVTLSAFHFPLSSAHTIWTVSMSDREQERKGATGPSAQKRPHTETVEKKASKRARIDDSSSDDDLPILVVCTGDDDDVAHTVLIEKPGLHDSMFDDVEWSLACALFRESSTNSDNGWCERMKVDAALLTERLWGYNDITAENGGDILPRCRFLDITWVQIDHVSDSLHENVVTIKTSHSS